MTRLPVCFAILGAILLLGSVTQGAQAKGAESMITFHVTDRASGRPLGGARVIATLHYSGATGARGRTDASGDVTFRLGQGHVSFTRYQVTISAPGHQSETMEVTAVGQENTLNVALDPDN